MKFIIGRKLNMSQVFDKEGKVIPVSLIEAGPCFVTQIKTTISPDSGGGDGYEAIQIGFEKLKPNKIRKTQKQKPFRCLREFSAPKGRDLAEGGKGDISKYKIGQKIDVSVFQEGDLVKITGISKGKGFAGVVKKWGFAGGPASHGSKHHRGLGSTGSRFPQRVIKGRKMPGRMGGERKTIKNLKIIKVDLKNNLLAVKGALPGRIGTLLDIKG